MSQLISAFDCNTNQDHEIFSDYVNVLENSFKYTESDLVLQIINTLYTVKYSRCTCQFFMMTYNLTLILGVEIRIYMKRNKCLLFCSIPGEIMMNIFSYLLPQDLILASQVCKTWHRLANDKYVDIMTYHTSLYVYIRQTSSSAFRLQISCEP